MTGGTEESIKLTAASPGKVLQDPGHSCDSNSSFRQNSVKSTPAHQLKAKFDSRRQIDSMKASEKHYKSPLYQAVMIAPSLTGVDSLSLPSLAAAWAMSYDLVLAGGSSGVSGKPRS